MSRQRKTGAGRVGSSSAAGILDPAPDAPWIEVDRWCPTGVCLEVGSLAVPKIFGLAFTASGEVFRACSLSWRNGECLGARFVSAKELRGSVETEKAEPEPEKAAG
jgi:hypothetical protein